MTTTSSPTMADPALPLLRLSITLDLRLTLGLSEP
jgi:hypothetical protein